MVVFHHQKRRVQVGGTGGTLAHSSSDVTIYLQTNSGIKLYSKRLQHWSDDRYPGAAPTLTDFLNQMPSNDAQDDGEAEDIRESAEAAFAASSQGT
jgi:hypothetical protein